MPFGGSAWQSSAGASMNSQKEYRKRPCDWHGHEIPAFRIFSLVALEIFDVLHNADSGTFLECDKKKKKQRHKVR